MNECWFATRIIEVRRKYGLTIDRKEADTLDRVLSACDSTELVFPIVPPSRQDYEFWQSIFESGETPNGAEIMPTGINVMQMIQGNMGE